MNHNNKNKIVYKNSDKIELPENNSSDFNWEIEEGEEKSNINSNNKEYRSMLKNTFKFNFKLHDFEKLL